MMLGATSSLASTLLHWAAPLLTVLGALAVCAAFFLAKLGQAQMALLKTGNEEQARQIAALRDELDEARATTADMQKALKTAEDKITILTNLVTGADAIAQLSADSKKRHDELMAALVEIKGAAA